MKYLGPTRHPRLNEAVAVVFLIAGLFLLLSLASYHPLDPSWNTVTGAAKVENLTGRAGAFLSDFLLQAFGFGAYAIPLLILMLGFKWIQSSSIEAPFIKTLGSLLLVGSTCAMSGLAPNWHPIATLIPAGGLAGAVVADYLVSTMNITGAVLLTAACWIVSLYLVSTFEMSRLAVWFRGPIGWMRAIAARWSAWRAQRRAIARERAEKRAVKKALAQQEALKNIEKEAPRTTMIIEPPPPAKSSRRAKDVEAPIVDPLAPPFDLDETPTIEDIPIHQLEFAPSAPEPIEIPAAAAPVLSERASRHALHPPKHRTDFHVPPTDLLQEPPARSGYDSQELKEIAVRIKSKFEEFNVLGSVTQINPGPVVTTFEFKPEAGVKYSRITTLSEDLCLGLQAESILIERIPGKPTVGIEVPNSKREVISLRQILESDEFHNSASPLTIALGKDINGRIKVAALDTMPHLLIAGSTGSGKSVMLNSLIMSILYKATPRQVRMIMVDPKRLEFGLYEGIPHLLTPVITDPKKATNALRNAVLEMERRLKLLASQGVRNIDQYNKKVRQLGDQPRSLFEEETAEEELEQIPYVLIVIDELADLMMLERANVEESRHPSGADGARRRHAPGAGDAASQRRRDHRIDQGEFPVAHQLPRGDPRRLAHGARRDGRGTPARQGRHAVPAAGIVAADARPRRLRQRSGDQSRGRILEAAGRARIRQDLPARRLHPTTRNGEGEEFDGTEDPMYQEAVRVVCDMGKASTSTLQRRLRLGYGRAARILDMMQRDGIIGPPDGSRPARSAEAAGLAGGSRESIKIED